MSRLIDAYDRSRVRAALLVRTDADGWGWLVVAATMVIVLVAGVTLLCLTLTPARAATVAPAQHVHERMHHKWNAF